MKKVISFIFLICCFSFNGKAQWNKDSNRDLKWIFGNSPSNLNLIDFRNSNQTQLPLISSTTFQTLGFEENLSLINDTAGNLLFYTNGGYVYDSSFNMMQNGDSISPEYGGQATYQNGAQELGQGSIILPMPANDSLYYIFHTSSTVPDTTAYITKYLYCSIVNTHLNNGKGAIIKKNKLLLTDTLARGRMTACRHANGNDWWILIKNLDGNTFHRFLLDSMGVHRKPSFSIGNNYTIGKLSQSCFSKLGNKYAVISMADWGTAYLSVYDFNRCTGRLSNSVQLFPFMVDSLNYSTGICFSPNEHFLYASFGHYVIQYNLSNNKIDTVAIKDTAMVPLQWKPYSEHFNFSNMQLGHDNRIYIMCSDFNFFHYINSPDSIGKKCDVHQVAFQVPTFYGIVYINLPHFTTPPLTDKCDTSEGIGFVTINELNDDWIIYPNPCNNNLLVTIYGILVSTVEVINLLGQRQNVSVEKLTINDLRLTTENLPSGVYFLKATDEKGNVKMGKFVKE